VAAACLWPPTLIYCRG